MGDEREGEDDGNDGEVVDAKVGVVLADAKGGIGERLGLGEGGTVGEFGPRPALGDPVANGVGDVVDEGTEGRGGDWGLGLGLGLGLRFGDGDREHGRRCSGRHGRRE